MRDRSLRLPLLAVAHGGAALVFATVVPLWAILAGPLILGVPHVVADVRYLLLDRPRGLSDRQALAILLPLAAAAALAVAGAPTLLLPGFAAIAGAVAFAPAAPVARVAAMFLLALAAVPLSTRPSFTLLLLAHAHHAVAVGLWLGLGRARPLPRAAAAAALFGGGVLISLGAFDFLPLATGGWTPPAAGFDTAAVGDSLALPGLGASRSLMLFAYGQMVHYAVWLRLVPGEQAESESPVSFRKGLDGLRRALGPSGFALAIALTLAVPLAGLCVPVATRRLYLDLAGIHAWLELAVAAHLGLAWLKSRRP